MTDKERLNKFVPDQYKNAGSGSGSGASYKTADEERLAKFVPAEYRNAAQMGNQNKTAPVEIDPRQFAGLKNTQQQATQNAQPVQPTMQQPVQTAPAAAQNPYQSYLQQYQQNQQEMQQRQVQSQRASAVSPAMFQQDQALLKQYGTYQNFVQDRKIGEMYKTPEQQRYEQVQAFQKAQAMAPVLQKQQAEQQGKALEEREKRKQNLSESEFARSGAMQTQYGTYENYLSGKMAETSASKKIQAGNVDSQIAAEIHDMSSFLDGEIEKTNRTLQILEASGMRYSEDYKSKSALLKNLQAEKAFLAGSPDLKKVNAERSQSAGTAEGYARIAELQNQKLVLQQQGSDLEKQKRIDERAKEVSRAEFEADNELKMKFGNYDNYLNHRLTQEYRNVVSGVSETQSKEQKLLDKAVAKAEEAGGKRDEAQQVRDRMTENEQRIAAARNEIDSLQEQRDLYYQQMLAGDESAADNYETIRQKQEQLRNEIDKLELDNNRLNQSAMQMETQAKKLENRSERFSERANGGNKVERFLRDAGTMFYDAGTMQSQIGLETLDQFITAYGGKAAQWALRDLANTPILKDIGGEKYQNALNNLADSIQTTPDLYQANMAQQQLNSIMEAATKDHSAAGRWILEQLPSAGAMITDMALSGMSGLASAQMIGANAGGIAAAQTGMDAVSEISGISKGAGKIAGKMTPNLAILGARAGGGAALEAKQKGATDNQALLIGIQNAATEVFSEMVFGGNPVYDADAGLVNELVAKVTDNKTIMRILDSKAFDFASEGLEEVVAELLEPTFEQLVLEGNIKGATNAAEIGNAFLGGMFLSILGNVAGVRNEANSARYEKAVKSVAQEIINEAKSVDDAAVQKAVQEMQDKLDYGRTPEAADFGKVINAMSEAGVSVDAEAAQQAAQTGTQEAILDFIEESGGKVTGKQLSDFSEAMKTAETDESMNDAYNALIDRGVLEFDEEGNIGIKEEYRNEQTDLAGSSERYADNGAGGEAGRMAEAAGTAEAGEEYGADTAGRSMGQTYGRESVRQAGVTSETDERADQARFYKEQVEKLGIEPTSPKSIGLANGIEENTVYELPERLWGREVKQAAKAAKDAGCNFKAVLGTMQLKNGHNVDAFFDEATRTVVVRADGLVRNAEQLGLHEIYHKIAAEDSSLNQTIRARIRSKMDAAAYEQALREYVLATRSIYDLADNEGEDLAEEEMLADAYAGMNRFKAADATKYTETVRQSVQERTNRQTAKATENKTGPTQRYSFAGENAKGANKVALAHAKQMQADGEDAAKILKDTGWFVGADGKWRYEIGDAEMETDTKDTMLRNPDARRYNELFEKAYLYDAASEEELQELQILDKNLKGVRTSAIYLDEIVKHDRLFEAYPALRDIKVRFEKDTGNAVAAYNAGFNEIVANSKLKMEKEKLKNALIHEIQHAIQEQEGFARGASPEYWASRTGYNDAPEKAYLKKFKSLTHEQQNQWTRYQELDRVLGELFLKDGKEAEYNKYEQQQDALYERLYPEQWFKDMLDAERMRSDTRSYYRELYMNTAGEIEARDAESRRTMTDEERRETMPNTGDEDTVFAEDAEESFDIARMKGLPWEEQLKSYKRSDTLVVQTGLDAFLENNENLPMAVPVSVITKAKSGKDASHSVSESSIRKLQKGMKNAPIIIDNPERNSIVYVTDVKDGNGLVTIAFMKDQVFDGDEVHQATTIHIREDPMLMLNSLNENATVYVRKNELNVVPRSSLLKSGTLTANIKFIGDSIAETGNAVKQSYSESEEEQERKPEKLPRYAKQEAEKIRYDMMREIGADIFRDMGPVKAAIDDMAREAFQNGEISEETRQAALDAMLDNAVRFDTEMYDNYKEVRDFLRKKKIRVPEDVKAGIPEFADFRKRNFGRINLSETTGMGIDQAYMELRELAPELFPADTINLQDQLERMASVREELQQGKESEIDTSDEDFMNFVEERFKVLADGMESEIRTQKRNEEQQLDEKRRAEKARLAKEGFDGRRAEAASILNTLADRTEVGELDVGDIEPAWRIKNTREMQDIYRQYAANTPEERRLDEGLYWYMKQKVANGDMAKRKQAISTMQAAQNAQDFTRDGFTGTKALEKIGVKIARSVTGYENTEQMIARDKAAKQTARMIRKVENDLNATAEEKYLAEGIASGVMTTKDIPNTVDRSRVIELADYYLAGWSAGTDMIQQRKKDIRDNLQDVMKSLFDEFDADERVKKQSALRLNYNSTQRNAIRIFGDELGGRINKIIFDPVNQNEGERTRWLNQQMDDVREFEGKDGKKSGLTDEESALVQQVLEGASVAELVAGDEMAMNIRAAADEINEGKNPADAAIAWGLGREQQQLAKKYAGWTQTVEALKDADEVKINNAVKAYREKFNSFYDAINDFLTAHGFATIGFIKNYAPHMQTEQDQTLLTKALQAMGISTEVTELPTSIAGLTGDYKPNKRWNPYFLSRTTDITKFDIQSAYQSYVQYLSDVLYHTDDIMTMRNMVNYFRDRYAPEEIRNEIDRIQSLRNADYDAKREFLRDTGRLSMGTFPTEEEIDTAMEDALEKLYEDAKNKKMFGNFVMYLDNYANILAGKQNIADRGIEQLLGRKGLDRGRKLIYTFQKSQVAANLSSALNQSAQLANIIGDKGAIQTARAFTDILTGKCKKADFAQRSDYLTAKKGVDFLVTDKKEMIISKLFTPAEFADSLMSTIAVRAAYNEALKKGMSDKEAMLYADKYGRQVMGDRSKGGKPVAFASKNPLMQMVNVFQIEALNTWQHLAQDTLGSDFREIERTSGKKAAARAVAGVLVKTILSAFILNRLGEELYGGTPAPFDFLGLSANFIASGYGLDTNEWIRTVIDNAMEKMTGERIFDTDEIDEEFEFWAGWEDLKYNVSNDIPFVRNVAGLLGWGDETLPIPNIGEWIEDVKKDRENGMTWQDAGEDAFDLITMLAPGGRQLTKTVKGIKALAKGGDYTASGRLKYTIDSSDPLTFIKAIAFGPNALTESRQYWASGGNYQSEKSTEIYKAMKDSGMSAKDAEQFMKDLNGIEPEEGAEKAKDWQKYAFILEQDLTDDQKRTALEQVLKKETMDKLDILSLYGVEYEDYARFKVEMQKQYPGQGVSQDRAEAVINSMGISNNAKKAALFQMATNSTVKQDGTIYNPYSENTALQVVKDLDGMKDEE